MLHDKVIVITGVANQRSIAYGVAHACARHGATLIVVIQSERFKSRAEELILQCGKYHNKKHTIFICDAAYDDQLQQLSLDIASITERIDVFVHSIAFANRDEIKGAFHDVTTRSGFLLAHDISSYTLVAFSKFLLPLLKKSQSASIITMTYYGSEKVIPNYNVMGVAKASLEACVRYLAASLGSDGVRVNALSPGPIQTLAASGITGLSKMIQATKENSPLKKSLTIEDVGNVAVFLASDLSQAISGEIIHVDNGSHCMGINIKNDDNRSDIS
ncbi:MAG: enoyl-ACP reductase [Methylacidiphilales bacterium]|nr:enoyl-ACP reductase [Candidatus Methylacidiphilales bacterium]